MIEDFFIKNENSYGKFYGRNRYKKYPKNATVWLRFSTDTV